MKVLSTLEIMTADESEALLCVLLVHYFHVRPFTSALGLQNIHDVVIHVLTVTEYNKWQDFNVRTTDNGIPRRK